MTCLATEEKTWKERAEDAIVPTRRLAISKDRQIELLEERLRIYASFIDDWKRGYELSDI